MVTNLSQKKWYLVLKISMFCRHVNGGCLYKSHMIWWSYAYVQSYGGMKRRLARTP